MTGDEPRNLPAVPEPAEVVSDVHYETDLDEAQPAAGAPVYVDLTRPAGDRLPIVPESLRGRANIKATLARVGGRHWHVARYHGFRSPVYLVLGVAWAIVGVLRIVASLLRWWHVTEQRFLRSQAAAGSDAKEWLKLHTEAKETRRVRGIILGALAAALIVATVAMVRYGQWWAWTLLAIVALPLLARHGRPADRHIIGQAVVTPRFRKLSADIVLRAYYSAKLGNPDKPDQQVTFGSPMMRDGDGSRVLVDLPYGLGLDDALKARPAIASGLDVTVSQVFLHRDPTSHRRHVLWVADRDPLAVPVGRTPMLDGKRTDIWQAAPIGLDERGQLVQVPLIWNSVLVSALPRAGKTFSARLLALYAALDPFVTLDVFDFKGSPDWRKFALVADCCAFGLTPTRAGLPIEIFARRLLAIKDDVQDRYTRLSELPADVCPEGKLTREIARNPRYGCRCE